MSGNYIRQRLNYVFSTYHLRCLRLIRWPYTGARKLAFHGSTNEENLLHQIGGWWLGLLFLLLDLILIGDLYEMLSNAIKAPRELTATEEKIAKRLFGDALRYQLIRLDEKAKLVCKPRGIAYVSLFTINSWGALSSRTLIHELVHVWQYQRLGLAYIPLALLAQKSKEGYDYGGTAALINGKSAGFGLASFNLEQQAEILADYYAELMHTSSSRKPTMEDHVSELEYFASQVRSPESQNEFPGRKVS